MPPVTKLVADSATSLAASLAMELRQCSVEDAVALALIGAATMLEAFAGLVPGHALIAHCEKNHTPAAFRAHLVKPQSRAWLAEVAPGRAPVGYALLTDPDLPAGMAHPNDLELKRIYLFSRFHGSGAGKGLMDLAIAAAREQQAKRLLLGVHPENHRAQAFYRKSGFLQTGTREFQVGTLVFRDPVFALDLQQG